MKPTTGKWRAHTEGRGVKQPRGHRKGPPLPQTTRSPGRTGPAVEITIVKRNSQRSFPRIQRRMTGTRDNPARSFPCIQRRMTGTPCVIFQNTHRTLTKATYNATRTWAVRVGHQGLRCRHRARTAEQSFPTNQWGRQDAAGKMRQRGRGLRCLLDLDPDNAAVQRDRGLALGTLDRFDEAIRNYEQSRRLEPDNPDAFTARGLAYNGQQRYDLAIQEFTRAIELDAGSAQTLYYRRMTYGFMGSYDQAIDNFGRSIRLDPEHAHSLLNRGRPTSTRTNPGGPFRTSIGSSASSRTIPRLTGTGGRRWPASTTTTLRFETSAGPSNWIPATPSPTTREGRPASSWAGTTGQSRTWRGRPREPPAPIRRFWPEGSR